MIQEIQENTPITIQAKEINSIVVQNKVRTFETNSLKIIEKESCFDFFIKETINEHNELTTFNFAFYRSIENIENKEEKNIKNIKNLEKNTVFIFEPIKPFNEYNLDLDSHLSLLKENEFFLLLLKGTDIFEKAQDQLDESNKKFLKNKLKNIFSKKSLQSSKKNVGESKFINFSKFHLSLTFPFHIRIEVEDVIFDEISKLPINSYVIKIKKSFFSFLVEENILEEIVERSIINRLSIIGGFKKLNY